MLRKRLAVALLAGTALLEIVAPPYFGVVADSDRRPHASLGHTLRWTPPSPEDVCLALRVRSARADTAPPVECPPPPERRSLFRAQVNLVRLLAESATTTGLALVLMFGRRRGE